MSLAKFADQVGILTYARKSWVVHSHERNNMAWPCGATAAVFARGDGAAAPPLNKNLVHLARLTAFGPPAKSRTVSLAALRRAVGRPHWRPTWNVRSRSLLGCVFDPVLLARALAAIPHRGVATLEVADMTSPAGIGGKLLRVVGDDWRIAVAGRMENRAPAIKLTALSVPHRGAKR